MDIQVKRDAIGRIIEADGYTLDSCDSDKQNYLKGMQDAVLACRQSCSQLDPTNAADTLNRIVAEVGRQVLDQTISRIEIMVCEQLKKHAMVTADGEADK